MITRRPTWALLLISVALLAVSLALFLLEQAPLGSALIVSVAGAWGIGLVRRHFQGGPPSPG